MWEKKGKKDRNYERKGKERIINMGWGKEFSVIHIDSKGKKGGKKERALD